MIVNHMVLAMVKCCYKSWDLFILNFLPGTERYSLSEIWWVLAVSSDTFEDWCRVTPWHFIAKYISHLCLWLIEIGVWHKRLWWHQEQVFTIGTSVLIYVRNLPVVQSVTAGFYFLVHSLQHGSSLNWMLLYHETISFIAVKTYKWQLSKKKV